MIALREIGFPTTDIAEALGVPPSTVSALLRRHGVARACEPGPGDLVHLELSACAGGRAGPRPWTGALHVAIDEATRLGYAELLPDARASTAVGFLRRLALFLRGHGIAVAGLLTSDAPCFASERYAAACEQWGISLLVAPRTGRPRAGRGPRFRAAAIAAWGPIAVRAGGDDAARALRAWLEAYNERTPQPDLGGLPPVLEARGIAGDPRLGI